MARYIDCCKCYHGRVCAYRHHYHDMIVECNHHIPTADVEEVKHGYWKHNLYCSVCGYLYDTGEYTNAKDFCPKCGAKMDGGNAE